MPAMRAGCASLPRPCPHRGCRWHLDPERQGKAIVPDALSCTLDGADLRGMTLDEIGQSLGVTRERARRVEQRALRHLARATFDAGLLTRVEGLSGTRGEAGAALPPAQPTDSSDRRTGPSLIEDLYKILSPATVSGGRGWGRLSDLRASPP